MHVAMTGEECEPPTSELSDDHIVAGVTKGSGDADPLGVGEKLVEP